MIEILKFKFHLNFIIEIKLKNLMNFKKFHFILKTNNTKELQSEVIEDNNNNNSDLILSLQTAIFQQNEEIISLQSSLSSFYSNVNQEQANLKNEIEQIRKNHSSALSEFKELLNQQYETLRLISSENEQLSSEIQLFKNKTSNCSPTMKPCRSSLTIPQHFTGLPASSVQALQQQQLSPRQSNSQSQQQMQLSPRQQNQYQQQTIPNQQLPPRLPIPQNQTQPYLQPSPRQQTIQNQQQPSPRQQSAQNQQQPSPRQQSAQNQQQPSPRQQSAQNQQQPSPQLQSIQNQQQPSPQLQSIQNQQQSLSPRQPVQNHQPYMTQQPQFQQLHGQYQLPQQPHINQIQQQSYQQFISGQPQPPLTSQFPKSPLKPAKIQQFNQLQQQPIHNKLFNGLFASLTTECHSNPVDKGIVSISGNSLNKIESEKLKFIIDNTWNDSWFSSTSSSDDSSITFIFNRKSVNTIAYAIRTSSAPEGGQHLKSWVLEGSNSNSTENGSNIITKWIEVDSQIDCAALNGPSKAMLFQCKNNNAGFFKFFRLRQTGPSHKGKGTGFSINNIEFFGQLRSV